MFNHGRKIIGKSVYYIGKDGGCYSVVEIYNGEIMTSSRYRHDRINDALEELHNIRCERYYTDPSRAFCL